MPELPEVESLCRQLSSAFEKSDAVQKVELFRPDLRFRIPPDIAQSIVHQSVQGVRRRGKYILVEFTTGTMISHLGMSGSWRWQSASDAFRKHDHVCITFVSGRKLVYHDPRRFGILDFTQSPQDHPLLVHMGPEPLEDGFDADYVWEKTRARHVPMKTWLMDNRNVVGVGNIYASEILHRVHISPFRKATKLKRVETEPLVAAIRFVLNAAIDAGGSTIRDYVLSDGEYGGYQKTFSVYDRTGELCRRCKKPIRMKFISGRSTFWCPKCQK